MPSSRPSSPRKGKGSGKNGEKSGKSNERRPRGRRRQRRGSFLGRLFYWTFFLGIWGVIAVAGIVAYYATKLPPIDQIAVPKRPPNIAIVASDGTLLANRGETGGRTVTLKELPPYLPKAFVAIEDHRFYQHLGIDPIGITRALARNVTSRGVAQGGSTLTQQLAKNLFLTQERTASRKIQEAILAIWLERNYTKDQILELYLNRVYFGSGAYGVEAAAQKYFGKSARSVTLSEAAVLAGLVQAPSRLAPNRNQAAAQARGEMVLSAMVREGFIDAGSAKLAIAKPATPVRPQGAGSVNYAADYVMDVLDDFVGTIDKDIVVTTTIDSNMQGAAESALVGELDQKGAKWNASQGAIVSLAPDGAVKALVGGRNYSESQFNRAVAAKRQPGSSFKPFIYLSAIEKGLTPDTLRDDAPISVKGWNPENFTRRYLGPVTLTKALALSLNTVAVRLGMEVGPKTVVQTAQRLGISSVLQPNASIALGTSEVSPLELTAAYAPFANGGTGVLPYVITRVKAATGETIYSRKPTNLGQVVDPTAIAMMNAMMRETLVIGSARKAELPPGWEAAGKTGTSQDFRDAWFVGYTGALVTSVWFGNDDSSPMKKVTGGSLPVETWSRYMKAALQNQQPVPLPGGRWQITPVNPDDAPAGVYDGYGQPVAQNGTPQPTLARQSGNPRPPADVANGADERGWVPPRQQERGLLDRLFGG